MINERIRQLRKQAWYYADDNSRDGDDGKHGQLYAEKFAELIVKECCGILMTPEYVMKYPDELTYYNRGWVNGRLHGIEHIKLLLGVKE